MDTIELVRREVTAWRRAHRGRRGPLPFDLRRRAAALAMCFGDDPVAAALDVDSSLLMRWCTRFMGEAVASELDDGGAAEGAPGFVEVGGALAAALAPATAKPNDISWSVEVRKPCGTTVRVQGPLDAASLEALVRAAGAVIATPGA